MLFISAAFFCSCSDAELAGTAEQRELGHVVLEPGLEFRLSPGTIMGSTETSVEARSSAPLPSFSLATGPEGAEGVLLSLSNIHREASVHVQSVRDLTAGNMPGCPQAAGLEGGQAEPVACTETPDAPECALPVAEPLDAEQGDDRLAQLELELSQPGCRQTIYSVRLPDSAAAEPLRLAVLGRTSSLDELQGALAAAGRDEPDLIVLLGDHAQNASLNGLRELEQVLRRADYPTVVLPGEDEIVEGSRTQFLQTFGPFDFRFDVKGVHHVAFYSASAELGQDGVERLEATLGRLNPDRVKLLFTHTPPIDPLGARDGGFESQIEGARTLSVLSERGVDALFTGHINDTHDDAVHGVKTHLTSVEHVGEYLWVVVEDGEVSVERRGI